MHDHTNVTSILASRPRALEFFAGVGLARMGLEQAGFRVVWANDYEPDKKMMYAAHFRDEEQHPDHAYELGDVFDVDPDTLPVGTSIAWGSSPCTDLSLAGSRGGIRAGESNAFWGYIKALDALGQGRPPVVVLENVVGLATSHGGDDLAAAIRAFNELGYSVDVLMIDARRFIPQSRPRLFLVGAMTPPQETDSSVSMLRPPAISWVFEDVSLRTHRAALPTPPDLLASGLADVVETLSDDDDRWWDEQRTQAFVKSLSAIQASRVETLLNSRATTYRTAYRRTRNGVAIWEVRPDEIAGCLRTARGGSSKQAVVQISGNGIRVRWMTPLEYARLMGAGEYNIAGIRDNKVLFAFGDAVAVPAVAWLGKNYLMPLVRAQAVREEVGISLAQ
ncbi:MULTISPECIES: DNA cytosine methyltransferase [Clavibacter]|uniref:DNA (cytosine-5-)-methyltransferase n=2 Tax=Clavibacter TaxID=1573 RepID=A0A399NXL1_9MICO|nr:MULTISPECIES: DNA cytosine methyltransferase [Clavibacter]KDP91152.1 DNA-cytosine methyltransferase [Clavibacter cf. michiganensis LMG 26808]RII98587.1 DNA (cytosine-5-)-methyltransferase [Clavibacter michiganensis]UKF25645.1 DNA cytosine methyltransferase [Clavibacter sp. A6099]